MKKPRILFYDIETAPSLAYVWTLWEANALKVVEPWYILCFSYKWLGEKTKVVSLPQFPGYKKDSRNDKELVKKLWELFNEADVIIGHNGDKFDIKKTNARFIKHGLTPPKPYQTVDTLKVARRHFKFDSNRLDALGDYLGVGRKVKTGGFDLWDQCMSGNMQAWKLMEKYNKQDVNLLETVYHKLKPWIVGHPNLNVLNGTHHCCPSCGSSNVQKRGYGYTRTTTFQRYQCNDCHAWSQTPSETKLLR